MSKLRREAKKPRRDLLEMILIGEASIMKNEKRRESVIAGEFETEKKKQIEWLATLKLPYEALLGLCADSMASCHFFERENAELLVLVNESQSVVNLLGVNAKKAADEAKIAFLSLMAENKNQAAKVALAAIHLTKTSHAKKGAKARYATDPKQAEKRFVFECWKGWRAKPDLYKNKTRFAADMLEKCMHLESQKKIMDWTREWEKGLESRPSSISR